jgi:hypothetical protein
MLGRCAYAIGKIATQRGARRDEAKRRVLGDFGGERQRCAAHLFLRHQQIGKNSCSLSLFDHRQRRLCSRKRSGLTRRRCFLCSRIRSAFSTTRSLAHSTQCPPLKKRSVTWPRKQTFPSKYRLSPRSSASFRLITDSSISPATPWGYACLALCSILAASFVVASNLSDTSSPDPSPQSHYASGRIAARSSRSASNTL